MAVPWSITVDSRDPAGQVAFWCLALGYVRVPPPAGAATWREHYLNIGVPAEELEDGDCCDRIHDPDGKGPLLWFQVVPEDKAVKNRLHFDLHVGGGRSVPVEDRIPVVRARVAQLVAAGGTELRELSEGVGHFGITLQDPEGNELCVT